MTTFVEISSLRDAQLTGISETVCRIAECALNEADTDQFRFIIGATEVHRDLVAEVIKVRNGTSLTAYVASGYGIGLRVNPDDWNAGIYCHRVSLHRAFDRQAMILYDLTPLICPQYHTHDTVNDFCTNFKRETAGVDHIVTISQAVYEDLAGYFPALGRKATAALCGLPHGALSKPEITLPISLTDKPYFLSLGTLEPRKNNFLIFETLAKYPELLDTHRFVFVGKRGWGDAMEALIGSMGLQHALDTENIVFTGFVDEEVKRQLIANSVALIYPSHYEGFGLPVIEAMALGRPVICQPTTSIPEVAGDFGYFFVPSSPEALHDAIRRVLTDAMNIASLADSYIQWATRFRWNDIWNVLKTAVRPPEEAR